MKGDRTIAQLSDQFGVHVSQITAWKEQLQAGAANVFGPGTGTAAAAPSIDVKALHAKIGELTLENGRDNVFVERLWRSVKYEKVVCCERHRSQSERWRCFTGDEGRPLEVGLQEQASNRHELHWSRAIVVSVDGKGGAGLR